MHASIFIAVEKYAHGQQIQGLQYAESDAQRFATVLEQHAFAPANRELLINSGATKTSIESALRTTLKRLTKDDTLAIFYAGHGFSQQGESYLTCHDTRLADLEHTSVRLQWLLQQLQVSSVRRVMLFLDATCRGLLDRADLPSTYADLDEGELQAFFASSEHCLCFASCQMDECSHRSSELKQGLWTHHLALAFDGQSPTALHGNRLTAASLQNYLKLVVPAALANIDPHGVQTPRMYSAGQEWLLASLEEILTARKQAKHPNSGQVKDSILLSESTSSVKTLSGFTKSKGHFIPDRHNSFAKSFITEIAACDLQEDLERVRNALKRAFGFKRLQLSVKNHGEGAATVTTPYFNYNVSVEQAADDPASVLWRRSVDAITHPDEVLSDAFETVFAEVFDTIELTLHDEVNLDDLIDAIEAIDSDEIGVDYSEDEQVTSCLIRIKGQHVSVKVTRNTFSVVHPRAAVPKRLLQSLFDVQLALTSEHLVEAIPFASADSV
jgi:hypothetical protein